MFNALLLSRCFQFNVGTCMCSTASDCVLHSSSSSGMDLVSVSSHESVFQDKFEASAARAITAVKAAL